MSAPLGHYKMNPYFWETAKRMVKGYLSLLFPNPKEFKSPPGFFKRWFVIPVFWIVLTVVGLALVTFVVLGILGILWSFVEPLFRDYIPREYVFMLVFLLLAILFFKDKR